MRRLFIALTTVALALTACGDDGGSGLGVYADAIAAGVQTDDADDSLQTSDDEAQCIGDGTAEVIGIDALEDAGTPEEVTDLAQDDLSAFDLDDDQSTEVAQLTFDCVDDILDQFIASFDTGSAEADACLSERLGEDQIVPLLAKSLQGVDLSDAESASLVQDLELVFQTCA